MASPDTAEPHALEHTWCFWEQNAPDGKKQLSAQEWKNLQRNLGAFNTVEDFWKCYSHLPAPSAVFYDGKSRKRVGPPGDDRVIESFSLFKQGIEVEWEDPANIRGGEWWIRKSLKTDVLDRYWNNLVLGLVGCTIENGNEITGARVVDKAAKGAYTMFRIELWLRTKDPTIRQQLRDSMIEVMTDGDQNKANELQNDFQWKMHGV
uniref:Eukaryotic translation initiation factor 4E n=1 Tax=Florenciella parvula TaxID=236787 RepID=A0A7S2CL47_9STRA|mmetsp:Transcript_40743/g.108963  ORF Transcript_40743/g.108963 Transcript_40743/m.108963 type:complete len:206 (+) Transcript_40743:133-750(+)|eukprot:CAMPEP_0119496170 /NCGR_PEP_ID=MMETSP1344-20130328/19582_1 /TAXON_ID=236787 /ORGANISM="Florenciella parvula, Strain CCMP2471" /LENGTH=205 /DNA_ID=CAMNT_0007531825 /DNA_START=63 /DNA_END=680 /DNA_ORIENTATION=+